MKKEVVIFLVILSKVTILFLFPSIISDVGYYYSQSNKVLLGFLPYTDFKFEYPPMAMLPIWVAGVLSREFSGFGYDAYLKYFRFILFSLDLGLIFFLKNKFESKPFYTRLMITNCIASLALAPLLYDRLDLIFGIICFVSLYCFYENKKIQGLSFAVLGIPFKLISLIFVPFIGISFWKERDFNYKSFMKWVAIPSLTFVILLIVLFKFKFLDFLAYHHVRGIQIESSWASVEFLYKHASGVPLHLEYNYGAQHLKDVSPVLVLLANYTVMLMLAVLFFFYLFLNVELNFILVSSLVVFITFGKVLSPQFIIWLLPLSLFFVDSKIELIILSAIALLTAPIIFKYGDLINQKEWAWYCIAARNLLLLEWTCLRFQKLFQLSTLNIPWKKSSPATGLAITPE